jgi:hypothetical protein
VGGLATDNGGPRSATANASTMAGKLACEVMNWPAAKDRVWVC